MTGYDVVFLGSSPNALAGAARLARAGRRVLVLETREAVGGPAATEAFAPGFRGDLGLSSLALDAEVARALDVHFDPVRRASITTLGPTPVTTTALPELTPAFGHAVELLRGLHAMPPPDVPGDAGALGVIAARLTGLPDRELHEVLRLLFLPVRQFLRESVASEVVRAQLAAVALRASAAGPFAPGTTYGLVWHQAMDDALFRSGAIGGTGRIALALAEAAARAGVEVRAAVQGPLAVDVEDGVARGVRLGGGRIDAEVIVSDHDARTTLSAFVSPTELDPETNRAVRNLRLAGTVARVHLALSGLPRFTGVDPEALRGSLLLAPDVAALERAWDDGKRGRISAAPVLELAVPSLADPSCAPEGCHVLDVWVQHVPRGATASAVLRAVHDALAPHAPGLDALVLNHHVSLPEDLEARFGLAGGQIYGGEVSLENAFFLRPLPGCTRYASPIAGLYFGGSAAHPGGYSGRAGWNVASALLEADA